MWALALSGGPRKGWALSPVSSGGRGFTSAEGRAGRRETSSTTAGMRAGGDRAGVARGTEGGDRPRPLGAQVSAAGLRVCFRLRRVGAARGRGRALSRSSGAAAWRRAGADGHSASVPSAERQGSVRASGTQPAAGPSCTQWGRGWPSRQNRTVRALRQSAQCLGQGVCCGAISASGHSEGDHADRAATPPPLLAPGKLPPPPLIAAHRAECL